MHFARDGKKDAVEAEEAEEAVMDSYEDGRKDAVNAVMDGSEDAKMEGIDKAGEGKDEGTEMDGMDAKEDGRDKIKGDKDAENGQEAENVKQETELEEISTAGEGLVFIVSSARLCSIHAAGWNDEFIQRIRNAAEKDPLYQKTKALAGSLAGDQKPMDDGLISSEDGVLYRKGRHRVPRDMVPSVLRSEHDSKIAGHFGQDKTIELVRRNFWWPKMGEAIIDYIRLCPDCQRDKSRRHKQYGLLSPLELPHAPWQSIAMDSSRTCQHRMSIPNCGS